jgi:hypothetical protein
VKTTDWPAAEFQAHRAHLRAVDYRMLGSLTEADDAVQETWLRLTSTGAPGDDFQGLLTVLDPAVVLRADAGTGPLGPSRLINGASDVAAQARRFAALARFADSVLVNGTPGFLVARNGRPLALIGLAVRAGKITEIDILADPQRLSRLDLTGLIH